MSPVGQIGVSNRLKRPMVPSLTDHQGKSLSLICASLTWLRLHKSTAFDASIKAAGEAFKDEPSWLIDQLLNRKRSELVQRFQDREKRLEAIRVKEKALEERGRKRRRIEERVTSAASGKPDDEDAEWLLNDWDDDNSIETPSGDAFSGLSKESREVLARLGIEGTRKNEADEEVMEEEIKVRYFTRTTRTMCRDSDWSRFIIPRGHIRSCLNSSASFAVPHSLHHYHNLLQRKKILQRSP